MKHIFYECPPGECRHPGSCPYCDGGLGLCTVCNGAEGQLTTDCVGYKLSEKILDRVWKGFYDFKYGRWVRGGRR
jgi:hypothetical protein